MAKAKRILKWQRDPEGMRIRILGAAKREFAPMASPARARLADQAGLLANPELATRRMKAVLSLRAIEA